MSRPGIRSLLFATALLTLPLPFYMGELEWAPLVRLAFFDALVAGVMIAEGGGVTAALLGLGLAQLAVGAGLLLGASSLVAAGLARVAPGRLGGALAVGIALALLGASLGERYHTPLSSTRARSSLLQLFE